MPQWYCPSCWAEVPAVTITCPACGFRLADAESWSYDERLLSALQHRLPDRQLMAARVLGDRRYAGAVGRLVEILQSDGDVYLRAEAGAALVRIGDPAGLAAVESAERDGPAIVRAAARAARRAVS